MTFARAHRPLGLIGLAVVVSMALAGCGGGSGSSGKVTAPGVTASATLSTNSSNNTPCPNLAKTISQIPTRLAQAASSNQPLQNVKNTLQNIDKQLMSQASNGGDDLKTAVQNYVNQLQQLISQASNGKAPNLSKLKPTQVENVCKQAGVDINNVSPSATASVSVSTSS